MKGVYNSTLTFQVSVVAGCGCEESFTFNEKGQMIDNESGDDCCGVVERVVDGKKGWYPPEKCEADSKLMSAFAQSFLSEFLHLNAL